LDIQVKERLTGAVILVALVVLLVPELLSGPTHAKAPAASPGRTLTPASAGLAKGAEAPLRSYTFDMADDGRARVPASAADEAKEPPAPVVEPAGGEADLEAQKVEAAEKPTERPAQGAAEKTVEKRPEKAAEKPIEKPVEKAAERPVERKAPSKTAEKELPLVTGWSIQVGGFAKRENAERMVKQLKAKGYGAFIAGGGGGKGHLYRVRVGPVADRAQAATLSAKLRSAGFPGSIVPHP
jgi:DedD protein